MKESCIYEIRKYKKLFITSTLELTLLWEFLLKLKDWNPFDYMESVPTLPCPVKLCQHWLWQSLPVSTARVHIMERTPPISTSRSVGASELRHGATSRYLAETETGRWNMTTNNLTDRLLELLGREDVQETARLYFEQGDVTINFIWIAVAGLAVLLCEWK